MPSPILAGDSAASSEEWLDLGEAKLFVPPALSPREERALTVLAQEVEKRTELRLPVVHSWPSTSTPMVVAGTNATLHRLHGHLPAVIPGQGAGR
jgi:hypothetical protein